METLVAIVFGIALGFLGWIGRELYINKSCVAAIKQEVTDLKDDMRDFINEYRDNHS